MFDFLIDIVPREGEGDGTEAPVVGDGTEEEGGIEEQVIGEGEGREESEAKMDGGDVKEERRAGLRGEEVQRRINGVTGIERDASLRQEEEEDRLYSAFVQGDG